MKFITITPVEGGGVTAQIENRPETTVGGTTENDAIANLIITHGEAYFEITILRKT